jgi:transposase-like protein
MKRIASQVLYQRSESAYFIGTTNQSQANSRNWARVIPFFDYPKEIRKVTTNAVESTNMSLRKVTKARSSFPTEDAVSKLFYLALDNISRRLLYNGWRR